MKKNKNRLAVVFIALLLVTFLGGCKGAGTTITSGPKGITFEFKELEKDVKDEAAAKFSFDNGILTVELESGTANVEICSTTEQDDDDLPDSYIELDTLYKGEGLKNGDEIEVNGVRGNVVMRVWGDGKNGKVKISPKK